MHANNERGIALVLALLLTSVMSVLATSLMFLSQTETYASMNYRMMSQSRYAGEAAIQKAGNFLLDSAQYVPPGSAADPLSAFNRTVSPVTYNGQPVVLSATTTKAAHYPVPAVVANFATIAQGQLAAGNATLNYSAYATLLSMQVFDGYAGGQSVVQTWQITGIGGLSGGNSATVEVAATIETPRVAAASYAAFATANTCGALSFKGNVTIDSYDSTGLTAAQLSSGSPPLSTSGGNVGTNGNLTIAGSVQVNGNLSTPRTGVGNCQAGAVTALTSSGAATVTGSFVALPASVSFPSPEFSTTPPITQVAIGAALMGNPATGCAALGLTYGVPIANAWGSYTPATGNCTVSGTTLIVDGNGADVTMPSVTVAGGYTLRIAGNSSPPQVININSLNGNGSIEIEANMGATNAGESVVLKVSGKDAAGSYIDAPFNLEDMGWKQNASANAGNKFDASALQIVYGGTGTINMDGGNTQSAATIYAPNADFILKGTQDLYGSVIARTITNGGNASIHYDRGLQRQYSVAGHPMASSFTWKRT